MPKTTKSVGTATSCTSTPPTVAFRSPRRCLSALMHNSLASIPLCLSRVPLIDHNPRRGRKIEFAPAEEQRVRHLTSDVPR